ncbi:hypothetical protein [Terrabacter sp. BE26]|uniref:hypothetical protein n=1 Tax=Terrabacter sp. BE26 TaxID=2898152 RepID=UPI0035BE9726
MTAMKVPVAIALAVVVAAGGCTKGDATTPDPDKVDAYVKVVGTLMPDLTREQILNVGKAACDGLDKQADLAMYSSLVQAAGENSNVLKGKVLVDGAISAMCPSHIGLKAAFDAKMSSS